MTEDVKFQNYVNWEGTWFLVSPFAGNMISMNDLEKKLANFGAFSHEVAKINIFQIQCAVVGDL